MSEDIMKFDVQSLRDETETQCKAVKKYFMTRSKGACDINNNLQNDYRKIESGLMLLYFLAGSDLLSSEIYDELISLFSKYFVYLDSNNDHFTKTLRGLFFSPIFELLIAHLTIESGYSLRESKCRPGEPDLLTVEGFFIECTMTHTSNLALWDKLLPKFDKYTNVVKRMISDSDHTVYEHTSTTVSRVLSMLSKMEIEKLAFELEIESKTIDVDVGRWILLQHEMRCHFEHLIPDELQKRLNEINIKRSTGSEPDDVIFSKVSKRIINSLIEKVQKKYFREHYGILAINTHFVVQGLRLSENKTKDLIKYFRINYNNLLSNAIKEANDHIKQEVLQGLQGLIGVILDTSDFNWFSSIYKKHELAKYPNQNQNNFLYLLADESHAAFHQIKKFINKIQYHESFRFIPDEVKFTKDEN